MELYTINNKVLTFNGTMLATGIIADPTFPLSGLQSYWSMDNVAGTTVYDSLNGYSGTSSNVTFTTGVTGNGATFNGSTSDINFGNVLRWDRLDPYTFSCWFKRGTTTGVQTLFSDTMQVSPFAGYWNIQFNPTNLAVSINSNASTGNWIAVNSSTGFTDTSSWHHLVVLYDGSSKASGLTFYLDGTGYNFATVTADGLTSDITIQRALKLGERDTIQQYDGEMDEVGIWDRVLSSDEVTNIYNGGSGRFYDEVFPTGATSYFNFNETGGTTASDSIAVQTMNHNGAAIATGIDGKGLDIQSGDYPRMTITGGTFNLSKTNPFTMSFWYKASGTGTRLLFDKQQQSPVRRGYECYFSSGNLYFNLLGNSTTNYWSVNATNPMPSTGVWYHVVWTYDGSETIGGLTLYVNGVSQSLTIGVNNMSTYDFVDADKEFTFGAYWDNTFPATGVMDELGLFDRELSAKEVSNIYNSGNGKFY